MPQSQFERILANASQLALVFIGAVVLLLVLQAGKAILAPVGLAIVFGLMFGPVADWVERRGIAPSLSAAVVVLLFLGVIAAGIGLFAVPLSEWVARLPLIWEKLRTVLMDFKEPLESLAALQEQVQGIFGDGATMTVAVEDGGAMTDIAMVAPGMLGEIVVFLASLYFYVATRAHIQVSVLSLCVTRRMRWRTAHVFRDVEAKVSRFLISITVVNVVSGIAVGLAMWAIGMPSPVLWGALAAVLNYIPYVGQALMALILLAVGLGTQSTIGAIALPVALYAVIAFVEGQIVTPQFMGRTLTLNPFMIFLAIAYWMWIWGPIGGIVAVPSLLILQSIIYHVLPSRPMEVVRGRPTALQQAARREVLDRAAELVKARAAEEEAAEAAATAEAEDRPSLIRKILGPGDAEAQPEPKPEPEPAKTPAKRRRAKPRPAVST